LTDVVAQLQMMADEIDEQMKHAPSMRRQGMGQGFREAAALVAADPLYKAAPVMAQKLREVRTGAVRTRDRIGSTPQLDAQLADLDALLATLPKEAPP
jgi:hypothetical protein